MYMHTPSDGISIYTTFACMYFPFSFLSMNVNVFPKFVPPNHAHSLPLLSFHFLCRYICPVIVFHFSCSRFSWAHWYTILSASSFVVAAGPSARAPSPTTLLASSAFSSPRRNEAGRPQASSSLPLVVHEFRPWGSCWQTDLRNLRYSAGRPRAACLLAIAARHPWGLALTVGMWKV